MAALLRVNILAVRFARARVATIEQDQRIGTGAGARRHDDLAATAHARTFAAHLIDHFSGRRRRRCAIGQYPAAILFNF